MDILLYFSKTNISHHIFDNTQEWLMGMRVSNDHKYTPPLYKLHLS